MWRFGLAQYHLLPMLDDPFGPEAPLFTAVQLHEETPPAKDFYRSWHASPAAVTR